MDHPLLTAAAEALGIRLQARGDAALLDRPRRMLLLSRAEKFPQPDAPWLLDTLTAVQRCHEQHEVLVTGLDRLAYDAARFAAAERDLPIIVVASQPLADDAELNSLTRRHLVVSPRDPVPEALAPRQRDRVIAQLCDRAWSIHVRKAGVMSELAEQLRARQVPVEPFATSKPPKQALQLDNSPAPPESLLDVSALSEWPYLTHFTRDPDAPWPGEKRADYLRWLCGGAGSPRRDAFATLCRMLDERRIRACGRLIPDRAPMVCFTARPAHTVGALRRWRRGLVRWNFTPYGLCLPRAQLIKFGAKPVTYAARDALDDAPAAQRPFMQLDRSADHDWTREEEWRIPGDVALDACDPGALVACVPHPAEARELHARYRLRSIVLPPTESQSAGGRRV